MDICIKQWKIISNNEKIYVTMKDCVKQWKIMQKIRECIKQGKAI